MARSPRRIQHLRPRTSNPPNGKKIKFFDGTYGWPLGRLDDLRREPAADRMAVRNTSLALTSTLEVREFKSRAEMLEFVEDANRKIGKQQRWGYDESVHWKPLLRERNPRHANPSSDKPFVAPDFYLIKYDISDYIDQKPKYVTGAYEVYLVDLNRHVHIASLTPSIEGAFLYTCCTVSPAYHNLSPRKFEEASDAVANYEIDLQSYTEPVDYFDASMVERMAKKDGYKVELEPAALAELRSGEMTYEEIVADLFEYYRGNMVL